ncbi:MAG: glycosyltransferase family 39 protein [Acidobacteriota bacterium]
MEQTALKTEYPRPATSSRARRSIPWILLGLIWLAVYFQGAFRPPLLDDADSTHAEAAREMYRTGDYVTLHVNGVRYLSKPPLPYWLASFAFTAFGVSEFGVRLPTILTVLLLIGLGALWGRRAFGRRGGIYAGLFVATCVGCFLFTRIYIPDVILSFLIALALYFFISAFDARRPKEWRWYAGYAAIALAFLTKGLVALVFVGFPAIGYLLLSGEWRRWRELRLGKGIALFFLIAAPWPILAGIRNHGFFWFYFMNEQFLRFLGERYPHDYNKLPALAYWSLHLVWLFPWSLYLPLMFRDLRRDISAVRNPATLNFAARTRALCWVWAGVVLVFFSFSTNQEYYTFPAYLPLLLLIAGSLVKEEEQERSSRWTILGNGLYAAAGVVAGSVLVWALWVSRHVPPTADLGQLLVHRDVANNATWTTGVATAVFLVAAQLAFVRFGPFMSSKPMADVIKRQERPGDLVMIYGDQAYGSSLLFYLKRHIDLVNGATTSMWFGSTFPDAPKIFLNDADLINDWKGKHRVFLFVPPRQLDTVKKILPQPRYVVAESSGKVLYSNEP